MIFGEKMKKQDHLFLNLLVMSSICYRKEKAKMYKEKVQIRALFNQKQPTKHQSLLSHRKEVSAAEMPPSFYFDPKERKRVMHSVIDGYLQIAKLPDSNKQTSNANGSDGPLYIRQCKTSENTRRKKISTTERIITKDIQRMSQTAGIRNLQKKSISELEGKSLPIIEEYANLKRPQTQGKKRRGNSRQGSRIEISSSRHMIENPISENNWNDFAQNQSSTSIVISDKNGITNRSYFGDGNQSNRSKISISSTKSLFKCKYFEYDKQSNTQHIIKKYSELGQFLYLRELKAQKLGAIVLWEKSVFDNQLVYEQENLTKSLQKQMYYKIQSKHGSQSVTKIYPNQQLYYGLFENDCEWLSDLIIGVCQQLQKIRGKVINNKISLDNVCQKGQKQVFLMDWSACSLRQKVTTLDKKQFIAYTPATLREQNNQENSLRNESKWLCRPQYLAPEIIRQFITGEKMSDEYLWGKNGQKSHLSDIWSLGCLLLQLITLIPLNAKQRHMVKGRNVFRRGCLPLYGNDFVDLERKQKYLSSQGCKIIKRQCGDVVGRINNKVLFALDGMLKFDRQQRLSPDEVIKILSP